MDLNITFKAVDITYIFRCCWENARIPPPVFYRKVHVLEFWVITPSFKEGIIEV